MNGKHLGLMASVAWAVAAVTSAAPVEARVEAWQSGEYATCNASYWTEAFTNCNGSFNYTTSMKFVTTACGSRGGCTGVAPDNSVFLPYSVP